jgi:hypothetical protein
MVQNDHTVLRQQGEGDFRDISYISVINTRVFGSSVQ